MVRWWYVDRIGVVAGMEVSATLMIAAYFGFPVAGATLPVIAFFLLGIYGKVIWMLITTVVLGIGHIGIHMQHKKEIKNQEIFVMGLFSKLSAIISHLTNLCRVAYQGEP